MSACAGTDVFILCFSVIREESFSALPSKWLTELKHHAPDVPILLVATQIDLREDRDQILLNKGGSIITTEEGKKMAENIGAVNYFEW